MIELLGPLLAIGLNWIGKKRTTFDHKKLALPATTTLCQASAQLADGGADPVAAAARGLLLAAGTEFSVQAAKTVHRIFTKKGWAS